MLNHEFLVSDGWAMEAWLVIFATHSLPPPETISAMAEDGVGNEAEEIEFPLQIISCRLFESIKMKHCAKVTLKHPLQFPGEGVP